MEMDRKVIFGVEKEEHACIYVQFWHGVIKLVAEIEH